jgi:hypothetical protein
MQNQEKPTLDLQSLDRNYFWIERPLAVARELRNYFDKVEDVSYINDVLPRLAINDEYLVYLPNGFVEDECQSNQYAIVRDSELQDGNTNNFQWTDSLDRVIDIVREMIEDDKPIKKSEVLQRMRMIMDDIVVIRQQITEEQLKTTTGYADDLYTHFNNIAIACDLDSEESLSWKLYSKGAKND